MKTRCINIDWLEVYCLEPETHDAAYFRAVGYDVESREYGTPLYAEMFTIFQEEWPFIEVRRNPHNPKCNKDGGILPHNACHIRLHNRTCYFPNCVNVLRTFLVAHGYQFMSISRVDICCDFNVFDNQMKPKNFVEKWFKAEISKLYQGRFSAHGQDKWSEREVNSIKWGRPTSAITTKLYNKSMELREIGDKFYIRDAWKATGLDEKSDVWRVEFSINSQAKVLRLRKPKNEEIAEQTREQEQEIRFRTLNRFDTSERLISTFATLSSHYFHFKKVERDGNGKLKEKRYCESISLFSFVPKDCNYVITKVTKDRALNRTERILVRKLINLMKESVVAYRQREVIWGLLTYLQTKHRVPVSDELSEKDWQEVETLKLENETANLNYFRNSEFKEKAHTVSEMLPHAECELIEELFTTLPDAPF